MWRAEVQILKLRGSSYGSINQINQTLNWYIGDLSHSCGVFDHVCMRIVDDLYYAAYVFGCKQPQDNMDSLLESVASAVLQSLTAHDLNLLFTAALHSLTDYTLDFPKFSKYILKKIKTQGEEAEKSAAESYRTHMETHTDSCVYTYLIVKVLSVITSHMVKDAAVGKWKKFFREAPDTLGKNSIGNFLHALAKGFSQTMNTSYVPVGDADAKNRIEYWKKLEDTILKMVDKSISVAVDHVVVNIDNADYYKSLLIMFEK